MLVLQRWELPAPWRPGAVQERRGTVCAPIPVVGAGAHYFRQSTANKEVTAVTTLPAKAGSFCLVAEALGSAGASRATLTAPRYVSARRLDPSPLSRTVYRDRLSPDTPGGVNATLTGERLTEPKLPGTRDMSCPRAFPMEPPKHIVRGKVPSRRCHKEERLSSDGLVAQPVACGDPHSPPGFSPESPAEVLYGH